MKIYTDGVFDLFHYGHANALRQAKGLGDFLVVGVNSSESASTYKNNPILTNDERLCVLKACRWVDLVVPNVPYFLDYELVKELECDMVVHGDDIIVDENGRNCYEAAQSKNAFMEVKRSKGVSTSELVGRLFYKECRRINIDSDIDAYQSNLIDMFSWPLKDKKGIVAYIDGSFDLYHAGHVSLIEEAKKHCDYLIVGLHNDEAIIEFKGEISIMREKERKLCLMSNKYIDEIIDNAPFFPGQDFLFEKDITVIYCGKESIEFYSDSVRDKIKVVCYENQFGYLSCEAICDRIISNYNTYKKKAVKK